MMVRRGTTEIRPGWVSLWTLVSLAVLLSALALAINAGWLSTAALELRSAADAAGLAATNELISDEWLKQSSPNLTDLLTRARDTATGYASANLVLGRRLELDSTADIVFGHIDPVDGFVPLEFGDASVASLDQVNAVRIHARRLKSRGSAIPILLGPMLAMPAMDLEAVVLLRLDQDVIGFRALPGSPIPMVPLGLRSDPTAADVRSWENQIRNRVGPDAFRRDPLLGFVAGADGIPEFVAQVQLNPVGNPALSDGYVLRIGTTPLDAQVTNGISDLDLSLENGKLVLDADNKFVLTGSPLCPAEGSSDYQGLVEGLQALRDNGQVRIYPLVSAFDAGAGNVTITGFVAARVVSVDQTVGGPLVLRLQPAMRAVPLAITDATRRGIANFVPNPYLAGARVVR